MSKAKQATTELRRWAARRRASTSPTATHPSPPPPPRPLAPSLTSGSNPSKKSRRGLRSRSLQYHGVAFYRRNGHWESRIWRCDKRVYLGGFGTAHAAASYAHICALDPVLKSHIFTLFHQVNLEMGLHGSQGV